MRLQAWKQHNSRHGLQGEAVAVLPLLLLHYPWHIGLVVAAITRNCCQPPG